MAGISRIPVTRRRQSLLWPTAAFVALLPAALAGCTYSNSPAAPEPAATGVHTDPATASAAKSSIGRETITDSFGNMDYYTTAPGDTLGSVAAAYKLPEVKVAGFNGLKPGTPLAAGTKIRLIPAEPMTGASGTATVDANEIPTSYTVGP